MGRVLGACLINHACKDRVWIEEQVPWRVVLSDLPLVHDQDPVIVNDGVDAVGDRDYGRGCKIVSNRPLD